MLEADQNILLYIIIFLKTVLSSKSRQNTITMPCRSRETFNLQSGNFFLAVNLNRGHHRVGEEILS